MIVNFTPITTIRKPALAVAGLLALAGCVPPPGAPTTTGRSAAATSPYAMAPAAPRTPPPAIRPPAEIAPPTPVAPSFSGPMDSRTGMRQSAVVSVSGNADRGFSGIFRPKQTEPASVDGAAARLCGDAGVASARTNSGGGSSAMPGVSVMVVKCGATA